MDLLAQQCNQGSRCRSLAPLLIAIAVALTMAIALPASAWSDPFTQQGEEFVSEPGFDLFGEVVALSSDGNTALIGAPDERVPKAWVFTRSGSTWTLQAKLEGSEVINNKCGFSFAKSVALSSDGNTALIGGRADCGEGGDAWVFTRSGSTWTQQGPRIADPDGNSGFGSSVALSADGNTAVIGGPDDKPSGSFGNGGPGAAWVYTREGSTWTQQGEKLTGGGESGRGDFGQAVALSSAGGTALITGGNDTNRRGAAWVFTRSGATWTQQGEKLRGAEELINRNCCDTFFGASAALSSDGNTAFVGGGSDNENVGAAWVFTRSGETWTQQGPKLTGGGESGKGAFGEGLSLSADGNTALIGGHEAAWVFTRGGKTWAQQGEKFTGSGETGVRGVAISSDAKTALLGGADASGEAAFVFVSTGPMVTDISPGAGATGGGTSVTISGANFTGATAVKFGSADAASFEVSSEGEIVAVSPAGMGTVDVAVTTPEGTSPTSLADQFIYSATPIVTKVSPAQGPVAGGTRVTITGTNFTAATAVKFGQINATSFEVTSSTSISAESPAEAAGTVDVTVTTPGGTTAISTKDRFKFLPTITKVTPNTGSKAGGTSVTITGTGFALGATATVFKFGTRKGGSVNCTSTTECTVVSPPHAVGTVDVKATVNKTNSIKRVPADQYTYN